MNKDTSSSSPKNSAPIEINLDEFMISDESFKPMTKGLGFHHDTKRPSFKPAPKEIKAFGAPKVSMAASLNTLPSASVKNPVGSTSSGHIPSGLEAFYGTKQVEAKPIFDERVEVKTEKVVSYKSAPQLSQFFAWVIDVLVIASFVALTEALLVLASGIELRMYSRLISTNDLAIFSAAIFSIYYLLYFTILDLGASPGKTVFGIRLAKTNGKEVSVKHTFLRALISLVSGVALFLPMLLDFQGRLSDTKLVK